MDSQAAKGLPKIRDKLLADHRRLDALLEETLRAIEDDDREAIANLFTEFDCGLRAHLEAEEQHLIPALLRADPRAARAIMAEHRHIRARLLELASAIDLHTIRFSNAKAFAGELRAHAKNEDTLLYRWADEHLGEAERNSLVAALVDKFMSRIRAGTREPTASAGLRE
jgi:hemerythrin-like domain-containing protein